MREDAKKRQEEFRPDWEEGEMGREICGVLEVVINGTIETSLTNIKTGRKQEARQRQEDWREK